MKDRYLVEQRGTSESRSLFDFTPYAYGPFDSAAYRGATLQESRPGRTNNVR